MRIAGVTAMFLATALIPQLPGDRPAPNPRATRSVVMARNGAIATSQPLATAAGLKVLQSGGNAIDAAVTAAAVLSVVEPTMNGHRRRSVRDPLRREDADRSTDSTPADARRRGDARRVPEAASRSDSAARAVVGERARRRGRMERAADQARHDHAGAGARAGHPVRTRRLRRQRDRLVAMA